MIRLDDENGGNQKSCSAMSRPSQFRRELVIKQNMLAFIPIKMSHNENSNNNWMQT